MIPFPGCQSKGDSLVTAPVTVLSPLGSYNLAHGFALQKAMERNTANIGGATPRATGRSVLRRAGPSAAALAGVAFLAAACGGGGHSSALAHIGTTTSTTAGATVNQSPVGGSTYQKAVQYAQCMRKNGVPNFPAETRTATFFSRTAQGATG